ncbi:hypothetical protein JHK84_035940 [Glycine max]|nr:hypothetical protein JHK85_036252 [Glycine max]KAG4976188.1 hypothetical protein JHK86_035662 [Glycine max]KAG5129543.1 hypothetical protein JHK84_035940 [Glycine max]
MIIQQLHDHRVVLVNQSAQGSSSVARACMFPFMTSRSTNALSDSFRQNTLTSSVEDADDEAVGVGEIDVDSHNQGSSSHGAPFVRILASHDCVQLNHLDNKSPE